MWDGISEESLPMCPPFPSVACVIIYTVKPYQTKLQTNSANGLIDVNIAREQAYKLLLIIRTSSYSDRVLIDAMRCNVVLKNTMKHDK